MPEEVQTIPKIKNDGFRKGKKVIVPKVIPAPTQVYTTNIGRARVPSLRWEQPEYDLAQVDRILDTEAFVRRAFRNKKNLFLKEGYEFVGSIPERVAYIKRRFRQMEEATNMPIETLMTQTVWCLIRCHNAFWVKARKVEASGGNIRTTPNGKKLNPVAGYFLAAPSTIRFKRDEFGTIKKYQQEIRGKVAREFNPEDVIHFYLDKREGWSIGTPSIVPVQDDIRALRRIEENVELLVYQHLFPLFHYKVGTPDAPADVHADGTNEVQEVQYKVATMPSDGCWVTPERHEIKALTAGQPPIAVEKVIAHFKQRIYTGLGVSSVDMGEGGTSNRSTAATMSRNLIDDTKADQKEFAAQFEAYVINELLLESTFSDATVLDDKNAVKLVFKEIDLEARQAKENHYVDIFLKNAITHDEMRLELGYEPFVGEGWPTANSKSKMIKKGDGNWAKTNYGLIERDKIILQSLDEPGTDASKAEAASRTTTNKTKSAGGNATSNKNTPSNQHGTRPSAKLNKDAFGEKNTIQSLEVVFLHDGPVQKTMKTLRNDLIQKVKLRGVSHNDIEFITDIAFSEAKDKLVSLGKRAYRIGVRDTEAEVWNVRIDKADIKIHDHINKYIVKLKNQIVDTIKRSTIKGNKLNNENAIIIGSIFDTFYHRSVMIDNSEIMRAYNYGKASGYYFFGDAIKFSRNSNSPCEICDNKISTLFSNKADAIIYEELGPFHPHCSCVVTKG